MAGWRASMSDRSSSSPGLSPPRSDSSTRSDEINVRMKLMCSYGGRILPRPTDSQLRYMGGESRIVAVNRSVTLPELLQKLRKLAGPSMLNVKYQLPGEELDALVSVKSEEDLENMMEEYDQLMQRDPGARLRVFLFSNRPQHQQQQQHQQGVADFTYRASDEQFIDALNGFPPQFPQRSDSIKSGDASRLNSDMEDEATVLFGNQEFQRLPPACIPIASPYPRLSPKATPPILLDDPWKMTISPCKFRDSPLVSPGNPFIATFVPVPNQHQHL